MSLPPRNPGTRESRASGDANRRSRPTADRSATGEETQSRSGATERTSTERLEPPNFNPRTPNRNFLEDTETYDSNSPGPSHFTHASSRPTRVDRSERTTESTPNLRAATRKSDITSVLPSSTIHGPPQQVKAERPAPLPEPTPKPKALSPPQLSDILKAFLKIESENYKACEAFCVKTPAVWSQDVRELRQLAIICLHEGKDAFARRCAERLLMLTIAQQKKWTADQANTYLRSLGKSDDAFQDSLDRLITKLGLEDTSSVAAISSPSSNPPQSSSSHTNPVSRQRPTTSSDAGATPGTQEHHPPAQIYPQGARWGSPSAHIPYRTNRPPPQTYVGYTTHSQAAPAETAAPEVEEGSEINDTVDDNVTLNEQQKQKRGINAMTRGLGPNLNLIDGSYEVKDDLDTSYRLYTGREAAELFVKGRVFAMVWHENVGSSANPTPTEMSEALDKPFNRFTRNADGVTIFSHIRRFVIIKAKVKGWHCLAIPIHSYRGQGLTNKKMPMAEKQAHTIIYDRLSRPVRMSGEIKLDKEPIAVRLEPGEELTESSRLHFGKMHSIDWNVKVKNVGRIVDPKHVRRLTIYFKQEFAWLTRGEDTETEGEGKGKGKEKGEPNR